MVVRPEAAQDQTAAAEVVEHTTEPSLAEVEVPEPIGLLMERAAAEAADLGNQGELATAAAVHCTVAVAVVGHPVVHRARELAVLADKASSSLPICPFPLPALHHSAVSPPRHLP